MNLRAARDGDGYAPDFPEGVSYALLADCESASWGLYEFAQDETNEDWSPQRPVSDALAACIESGMRYPPALALARDDLARMFSNREPTKDEFAARYAESIRSRLASQRDAGFLLAPAVREEPGYLTKEEWYWVLRVSESDPDLVEWVSGDFYVYSNAVTDFDLTEQQLETLKGGEAA